MGGAASRAASRVRGKNRNSLRGEDDPATQPKTAWGAASTGRARASRLGASQDLLRQQAAAGGDGEQQQSSPLVELPPPVGGGNADARRKQLQHPGPPLQQAAAPTTHGASTELPLRSSLLQSSLHSHAQTSVSKLAGTTLFSDEVFIEDLEPNGINVSQGNPGSRKNLRHIYRLCGDLEESGLSNERKRLRARGVDVLFGKTPENDEKMDRSRNQGPVSDEYATRVLNKVKLFKDLEMQVPGFIESLCQSVTFVRALAGEVVCCQGDIAANAYIIARGEVSVHVLSENEVASRQNIAKWKLIGMHKLKTFTEVQGATMQTYKTLDGKGLYAHGADHGRDVGRLGEGNVLGEVALLNRKPRGGTVVCVTDCDFFVVEKKYFEHILRPMGLLSPLKFFQEVEKESRGALERIAQVAHFCDASAKQIIFRQGDPGEHCYVLVSGEVGVHVISPDFISPRRQHIETYELFIPDQDEAPRKKTQRRFNAQRAHSAINRYRFRTFEGKGTFMKRTNFGPQIAVLGPGSMTGELALISRKPREVTIRCLTDCHFLVVRKDDFQRVLHPSLLLQQMSFFIELERKYAGIVHEISAVVSVIKAESGQVLFRQTDPPGHCYALVRGSVGVSVLRNQEELDAMTPRGVWEAQSGSLDARYKTIDALNTYSKKSNLGQQVTVLKDGVLIGESALSNDNPRMASLHCLEDCTFFAIRRVDFEAIVEDGEKKIRFLEENLPYLPHLEAAHDNHPATCFQEVNVLPGKPFLTEGIASEAAIYFVQEGLVEFCRCDLPAPAPLDPLSEFSKRPISTGLRDTVHMRSDVVDTLGPGGIFCSLAFIPLPAVDPFTIVAGDAKCRVYVANSEGIKRMPPKMLTVLKQQLATDLWDRLVRVRERYPNLLEDITPSLVFGQASLRESAAADVPFPSEVAPLSTARTLPTQPSTSTRGPFSASIRRKPKARRRFADTGAPHRGSVSGQAKE